MNTINWNQTSYLIAPDHLKFVHTIFLTATITSQYQHLIYSDTIYTYIYSFFHIYGIRYIPKTHFSLVSVHDRIQSNKRQEIGSKIFHWSQNVFQSLFCFLFILVVI